MDPRRGSLAWLSHLMMVGRASTGSFLELIAQKPTLEVLRAAKHRKCL